MAPRLLKLYIAYVLHQTTTTKKRPRMVSRCISLMSYIKPQLKRGDRDTVECCISLMSYIKPQLARCGLLRVCRCISLMSYIKPQHANGVATKDFGCISLMSYIKPQRAWILGKKSIVVYRLCPTSNHNAKRSSPLLKSLYIAYVLHQTTTRICRGER